MNAEGLCNPLCAAALSAAAAGLLGPFVLARRATYVAGAVSHSMMAGIGLAAYCGAKLGMEWFTPFAGSIAAAVAAALALAAFSRKNDARTDAVLSGIWAGGFAAGLVLMLASTGEEADVEEYLVGSILGVESGRLVSLAALDAAIAAIVCLGFGRLTALSFDKRLAGLRGVNVPLWETAFAVATALAVALLAHTGGILTAIALLSLPAAAASRFSRSIRGQMALAAAFAFAAECAAVAAGKMLDPRVSSAVAVFVLLAACAIPAPGRNGKGRS